MAWAFFEAQFAVVRGVTLPANCLPWLRTEDSRHTFDDEDASSDSANWTVPFRMHPDVAELGTAGPSLSHKSEFS